MFATNGFSVGQGVGPRKTDILAALRAFRRRSSQADVGVIYCTGHGIESDGQVFLLPGDFPGHAELSPSDVHARAVIPRSSVICSRLRWAHAADWRRLMKLASRSIARSVDERVFARYTAT